MIFCGQSILSLSGLFKTCLLGRQEEKLHAEGLLIEVVNLMYP